MKTFTAVLVATVLAAAGVSALGEDRTGSCRCGVENAAASRILGGTLASPHQYPWMASLRHKTSPNSNPDFCSGVVVDSRHVLTSASCVKNRAPADVMVAVGEHNVMDDADGQAVMEVESWTKHPSYQAGRVAEAFDVLVVKLKEEITFSDTVSPICLNNNDFAGQAGAVLAGFGAPASGNKILNVATGLAIESGACTRGSFSTGSDQLCTKPAAGGTNNNIRRRDIGGALSVKVGDNHFLAGVNSYAWKNTFNVYGRVSVVYDWIVQQTTDGQKCDP